MITELVTFTGFPHWLTRKDKGDESILTMAHDKQIEVGDGFCFFTKPNMGGGVGNSEPDLQPLNYFKVAEIIEQRLSKGKWSTVPTPQHYKLRCERVNEVIDFNQIKYSKNYEPQE